MEDTLRSASPNLDNKLRSASHRFHVWRTEKNLSFDDYQEMSDHFDNYDDLDLIDGYAENMQRAMSEKNVLGISSRFGKKRRRQFRNTKSSFETVSDDGSEEVNVIGNIIEDDYHHEFTSYANDKRQTHEYEYSGMNNNFDTHEAKADNMSMVCKIDKKRNTLQKKSTKKTNSIVDIESINGKVRFHN
jgi:hypothetical protein